MDVKVMRCLAFALALVFRGLWCLCIILCALAGVFALTGTLGLNLNCTVPLDLPIHLERLDSAAEPGTVEPSQARITGARQATLAIPLREIKTPERVCFFAALFCNVLTMHLLLGFLHAVKTGRPFQPENARRIRWVGLTLILSGILGNASGYILAGRFMALPWISRMHAAVEFDWDGGFLVIGILIILFAEVFRLGAYLQQEQDLTV